MSKQYKSLPDFLPDIIRKDLKIEKVVPTSEEIKKQ